MKTSLSNVVEEVVDLELAKGTGFSAYDITRACRIKINNTALSVEYDLPLGTFRGLLTYEVSHTDVKDIIEGMFNNQKLNRFIKGGENFYRYEDVSDGAPTLTHLGDSVPIPVPTNVAPVNTALTDIIYAYLLRCRVKGSNFKNIKQIASAIRQPGLKVRHIHDAIDSDPRLKIYNSSECNSSQLVKII